MKVLVQTPNMNNARKVEKESFMIDDGSAQLQYMAVIVYTCQYYNRDVLVQADFLNSTCEKMTDKTKINSRSRISRIYSISFPFWTERSSKILPYAMPVFFGRNLRNMFCIIIAVALLSGTFASIGSKYAFGESYVNIASAGDWGCTGNTQDTVKNVQKLNPDLLLALGDYSYTNTPRCWFDTIRPVGSITKVSIGNHDVQDSALLNSYLNNFGLTRQYYSYKVGSVHVLTMATEETFAKGSQQYDFVLEDLQAASSDPSIKWTIVNLHVPFYASPNTCGDSGCAGDKDLRETYHPLFDKYGVDLVLAGHVHNYQRSYPITYNSQNPSDPKVTSCSKSTYSNPEGEIYAIVGTGGVNLHGLSGKSYFIASQQDSKFGIFSMHISSNTLEAKFIDNAGNILDQFIINKNMNIKNIESTECSPDRKPTIKSVNIVGSDLPKEYSPVVKPFKVNYVNPVLPKLKTFEIMVKAYNDKMQGKYPTKVKIEKIRQNIHEQISKKIEKKIEDMKLKDKVDNKNVKDEETTTTSDSSWPLEDVKLKDKVDKSLTTTIAENIKQKLKKKLTTKFFGSGFPFH